MHVSPSIRGSGLDIPFLADPLTGFGSRRELFADLDHALEPGCPPSIFAVFDLAGVDEHRRVYGERASDLLIVRLAEAFARVVRPTGVCYRPRRDEFCVLADVPGEGDDMRTILATAASRLLEIGESFAISSWYGAILLPDEAAIPIEALMLADERLRSRSENRQPRERRQNTRNH